MVLLTSAVLLFFGLFLPVITLKELVFWTHTFSVLTGITSLFHEKQYFLGVIIFFFSIVFPIFKLAILAIIWFSKLVEEQRASFLYWLGVLGKWSMLDVFVIAVTIVVTKISTFAEAQAETGIYFFGGSILLAMLITERIERLLRQRTK
ncbi:MAG: hypothetical protein A2Z88_02045 [Omnitrophica WOR_2 bacterium GWA2_47_8]|nr:MAG: hypothetical protein A2Z88_02045 [Omnitrophica WOR_2 bacterium GWA2_47_8]